MFSESQRKVSFLVSPVSLVQSELSSKQAHRYFLFQVFGKAFGRNLKGNIGSSLESSLEVGLEVVVNIGSIKANIIKGKSIEQYFIEQLIEQYFIEQLIE